MIDVKQYIGVDTDDIIEDMRGLHEDRANAIAAAQKTLMKEDLDNMLASLTIAIRKDNPKLNRVEAEEMARCTKEYKDLIDYFRQKIRNDALLDMRYWEHQKRFDSAMKKLDFAKQETFIMNRSK